MNLSERTVKDIYIISISGRMDTANAKDIEAKLNEVIDKNSSKIIINLAAVDYISSSGLRVLLAAYKRQGQKNNTLVVVSVQPSIEKIFRITGLDRIFTIYPTEEIAIQKLM